MTTQKQAHSLANRARRIARRIRDSRNSLNATLNAISATQNASDEEFTPALREARVSRLKKVAAEEQSRLNYMTEAAGDLTYVPVPRSNESASNRLPFLPRTENFRAARLGRREGKCFRAFTAVASSRSRQ